MEVLLVCSILRTSSVRAYLSICSAGLPACMHPFGYPTFKRFLNESPFAQSPIAGTAGGCVWWTIGMEASSSIIFRTDHVFASMISRCASYAFYGLVNIETFGWLHRPTPECVRLDLSATPPPPPPSRSKKEKSFFGMQMLCEAFFWQLLYCSACPYEIHGLNDTIKLLREIEIDIAFFFFFFFSLFL